MFTRRRDYVVKPLSFRLKLEFFVFMTKSPNAILSLFIHSLQETFLCDLSFSDAAFQITFYQSYIISTEKFVHQFMVQKELMTYKFENIRRNGQVSSSHFFHRKR